MSSGNDANAVKILCGAMKQLKLSRLKPDPVLNAALSTLIKESPQLFSSSTVVDGLVAVLKRESSVIFKAKSNPSVYILAAQLLLLSLKDSFDWSESIAKVILYVTHARLMNSVSLCFSIIVYAGVCRGLPG